MIQVYKEWADCGPPGQTTGERWPWQGPREPWADDGPWCYEWSQIAPCRVMDGYGGIKACRAAKAMNKGKVTGNPAAGPGPPMGLDTPLHLWMEKEGYKCYETERPRKGIYIIL